MPAYTERILRFNTIDPDPTHPAYNPNLGTAAWGNYFQDPHILDPLIPYFDTLGIPWDAFSTPSLWQNGGPNQMWVNLFKILNTNRKNVEIEGGYIYNTIARGSPGSLNGATVALDIDVIRMQQMMALGCPQPRLIMDGHPINMAIQVTSSGGSTPVFTQANFTAELTSYLTNMYTQFPTMKIGLDVNYHSWQAFGHPSYYGPSGPTQPTGTGTAGTYTYFYNNGVTPDYATVLSNAGPPVGMIQAMSNAGLPPFAYFAADYAYEYFMNYAVHSLTVAPPWAGAGAVNWANQLLLLQSLVQANGIPFCPQYNAFIAGNSGPNSRFYYECLDYQTQYLAQGGNPDRFELINFTTYPTALFPVTQYNPFNYSLGSLARSFQAGDPTNTPVFQLFASGFKPQYLFIDSMTARAFYLAGGYADTGIAFQLPGDELFWQQPDSPLNPSQRLLRVTQGIDVIVNPNAPFIQTLINAGWTPTPCSGWVASLTAPNPPPPNN